MPSPRRTHAEQIAGHATRPVDWRWRRAIDIVAHGKNASRKRDDSWTCRAIAFIRASRRSASERNARRVALEFPEIYIALKATGESGLRPLEIRARILAGQSDRAIARRVGLPVKAVAAFAALFFGVRDRLHATSYISHIVIGLPVEGPPSQHSLLLAQAYHFGPQVISPWFDFLQHMDETHDLATPEGRRREAIAISVAVRALDFGKQRAARLVKQVAEISIKASKRGRGTTVAEAVSRNVMQNLAEIAWRQAPDDGFAAPMRTWESVGRRSPSEDWQTGRAG